MRELSTYAFINAKIRAMLSFLISQEVFLKMIDAQDIYDAAELLKGYPHYKEIVECVVKGRPDYSLFEKQFIKNDLNAYKNIYKSLPAKIERKLIEDFIEKYEVEQLKTALRIWHKKVPVAISDYILEERISFAIDYKKIIYAPNIEEIIFLLDDTPYRKPILNAREKFKKEGSVFYLEACLDADYYSRLVSDISLLSGRDMEIAKKIIGIQIDNQNINWLIKMRKYYNLPAGEMLEWVISGGNRIDKDNIAKFYTINGLGNIAESVALGPYLRIKDLIEENISLIENFLHEVLIKEVKKALSGYPFTIGTVLSYMILKNSETRNVVSLLYAKKLGISKEELMSLVKTI